MVEPNTPTCKGGKAVDTGEWELSHIIFFRLEGVKGSTANAGVFWQGAAARNMFKHSIALLFYMLSNAKLVVMHQNIWLLCLWSVHVAQEVRYQILSLVLRYGILDRRRQLEMC